MKVLTLIIGLPVQVRDAERPAKECFHQDGALGKYQVVFQSPEIPLNHLLVANWTMQVMEQKKE
jgi:hypothetical protein